MKSPLCLCSTSWPGTPRTALAPSVCWRWRTRAGSSSPAHSWPPPGRWSVLDTSCSYCRSKTPRACTGYRSSPQAARTDCTPCSTRCRTRTAWARSTSAESWIWWGSCSHWTRRSREGSTSRRGRPGTRSPRRLGTSCPSCRSGRAGGRAVSSWWYPRSILDCRGIGPAWRPDRMSWSSRGTGWISR